MGLKYTVLITLVRDHRDTRPTIAERVDLFWR